MNMSIKTYAFTRKKLQLKDLNPIDSVLVVILLNKKRHTLDIIPLNI